MKRVLLIAFAAMLTGSLPMVAKRYNLLTDKGQVVNADNVAYLMAADNDEEFTIVLKDNSTVPDVQKATVVDATGTGFTPLEKSVAPVIIGEVHSTLTLAGCGKNMTVAVYGTDGSCRLTTVGDDQITLDVSSLACGVYILRAGNTNVKFIKK